MCLQLFESKENSSAWQESNTELTKLKPVLTEDPAAQFCDLLGRAVGLGKNLSRCS